MKKQTISALLLLTLCCSTIGAQAQNNTKNNGGPKPTLPGGLRNDQKLATEDLSQKVELPNLPDFTGQQTKFKGGVARKIDKTTHYIQHFDTREDARQVLDWYVNTLSMYKWKIEVSDHHSVMAKMPLATCSVFVQDISSQKKPYKAEVEINYIQNTR